MPRRSYDTSLSTRVGAIRRELAAAFGMLALVFNLLAGVALAAKPIFVSGNDDGRPIRLLTCLPGATSGLTGADGMPAGTDGEPHCLFCLPLLGGGALAPSIADLPRPPVVNVEAARITPPSPVRHTHFIGPPPRGPPAV